MKWQVTFYNEKVKLHSAAFPKGVLANFLHVVGLIEKFGPRIGIPYTRPLGSGLFEIRARGKEGIARVMFCMLPGKELVLLNAFIKKSQKTPSREIALARKRMRELLK